MNYKIRVKARGKVLQSETRLSLTPSIRLGKRKGSFHTREGRPWAKVCFSPFIVAGDATVKGENPG